MSDDEGLYGALSGTLASYPYMDSLYFFAAGEGESRLLGATADAALAAAPSATTVLYCISL